MKKEIVDMMIHIYDLDVLKYDFMGYTFKNEKHLSYHHLLIPARCGGPITIENGALLVRKTAHDYLHRIERYDKDVFDDITEEMHKENINRKIEIYNLRRIRQMLEYFEKEHSGTCNKKGKPIIQERYIRERIKLK